MNSNKKIYNNKKETKKILNEWKSFLQEKDNKKESLNESIANDIVQTIISDPVLSYATIGGLSLVIKGIYTKLVTKPKIKEAFLEYLKYLSRHMNEWDNPNLAAEVSIQRIGRYASSYHYIDSWASKTIKLTERQSFFRGNHSVSDVFDSNYKKSRHPRRSTFMVLKQSIKALKSVNLDRLIENYKTKKMTNSEFSRSINENIHAHRIDHDIDTKSYWTDEDIELDGLFASFLGSLNTSMNPNVSINLNKAAKVINKKFKDYASIKNGKIVLKPNKKLSSEEGLNFISSLTHFAIRSKVPFGHDLLDQVVDSSTLNSEETAELRRGINSQMNFVKKMKMLKKLIGYGKILFSGGSSELVNFVADVAKDKACEALGEHIQEKIVDDPNESTFEQKRDRIINLILSVFLG